MPPTRVALIGLSASASGTGWATTAHLPYLLKSPHYTIAALCNSSLPAAHAAIKAYNLPASTKTYASPHDLAQDPDIDLVVANTRVDRHAEVLLPSLRAGKNVFCEWPMDRDERVARAMLDAAREGGGKAFVGLQGRQSPVVRMVKGIIDSGRIGRVLSSTAVGAFSNGGGEEGMGVKYFADRSVGGNVLSIHFGHSIDAILYTLGEFASYSTILANQRPQTNIVDRKADNKVVETVTSNTADQVLVQGTLTSGAVLSAHFRGGKPFPGATPALWRIYGEKGEIEISGSSIMLNTAAPEDAKILLHDQKTGSIEEIKLEKDEFDVTFDDLPNVAKNIGRLYEAYRKGEDTVVYFEEAVGRHELLADMYVAWDKNEQGRPASSAQ